MLSRIPERLTGINGGLSHAAVPEPVRQPAQRARSSRAARRTTAPGRARTTRSEWKNTMIGDGGQSGFDVAIPSFRFHNFTGASPDVNFENGDFERWIWTGDPLQTGGEFYAPVIGDPVVSKTMFAGTNRTAYRTKTAGLGTRTIAEAHAVCNEWTGNFSATVRRLAELGNVRLTAAEWGDSSWLQPGRSSSGRRPTRRRRGPRRQPVVSSSRRTSTRSRSSRWAWSRDWA